MSGLVGQSLDHYRIVEQIGQGGMATVYRAVDGRRGTDVAVKVLSPTIGGDKKFVRRFRREAELLARLKHPHIVSVMDYGETRGMVYLVMPFVAGETLHEKMSRRKYGEVEIRRWIGQVAQALSYAHQQGVIHRDVKPSNVLIDKQGRALLSDFGLARLAEGSGTLTGSLLMGTPAYVSPEQGRGERVDARSDLYSFGVILFQLVTGRLPFDGETPMATVLMHMQEPPPLPRSLNPSLPAGIEKVILKCLAKGVEDRFANVEAAAQAFERAMDGATPAELGLELVTVVRPGGTAAVRRRQPAAAVEQSRMPRWAWLALLPLAGLGTAVALPALQAARQAAEGTPVATTAAPAILAATSTSPPLTAVPQTITSADCPGMRLMGIFPEGNQVSWLIDNGSAADIRIAAMPDLVIPTGYFEMALGDEVVWSGESESGDFFFLPDANLEIPAGTASRLTIRYSFRPGLAGYDFNVQFDNGCLLGGKW